MIVIMIATDEDTIVIMVGLEHGHTTIGSRTNRTACVIWDGEIDLILQRVSGYRVRATRAGGRSYDDSLVLRIAGGIDNGKLFVRPMRAIG